MGNSAQGIVEKATTYNGKVMETITIEVVDENHNPMSNMSFSVTFSDGQKISATSDGKGIVKIPMRTSGKINLLLQ